MTTCRPASVLILIYDVKCLNKTSVRIHVSMPSDVSQAMLAMMKSPCDLDSAKSKYHIRPIYSICFDLLSSRFF